MAASATRAAASTHATVKTENAPSSGEFWIWRRLAPAEAIALARIEM